MHIVTERDGPKGRRVRWVQRWLLNPPVKLAAWWGVAPGLVVLETTGRRTGELRHNVVGMHLDGDTGWVVAEFGRHAGYVRNLEAQPRVRVRQGRRWRPARAQIVDDDDPQARLDGFGRRSHAAAVRTFGTELTTIRFDFAPLGDDDREAQPKP
jgi:deazaflavin-dependent oxidoreductase (nitroreductase family)